MINTLLPFNNNHLLPSHTLVLDSKMSANTATAYQTVKDIITLYALSKLKAEQLLTKTEVIIDHSKSELEGIAEWED